MERLVRLVEDTPQEKCIAVFIDELRRGLSYRHFLAALFLASVRQDYFDHTVYMVHAAHQMSLDVPVEDRLLPLFADLRFFKASQERWLAKPLEAMTSPLPSAADVDQEFTGAMEKWDHEKAEAALVALTRTIGPVQAYDRLWPYLGRDWGFIGHKAIAVACGFRTLTAFGWHYAEPTLRFALRMLFHESRTPAADAVFQANRERTRGAGATLPAAWSLSAPDAGATRELLASLRSGAVQPSCELALKQLAGGHVSAGAVWDAVHLAAAELMIRHRGSSPQHSGLNNRPVHSTTSVNALRYAFSVAAEPETRLLNLLQAVAWVAQFTWVAEHEKEALRPLRITDLAGEPTPESAGEALEEIFSLLPRRIPGPRDAAVDRSGADLACRKTFTCLRRHGDAQGFMQMARRLVLRKTTEVHAYKFPVAIFEDAHHVSPVWREHLLAASVHFLRGTRQADNAFMQEARLAIGDLPAR